jgi:hypothetical protein
MRVCSLSLVNNWVKKTAVITTENVKSRPLYHTRNKMLLNIILFFIYKITPL